MFRSLFPKASAQSRVGKKLVRFFITERNREKLSRYLKDRSRATMLRREFADRAWCLRDLSCVCLRHATTINAPLALILETSPNQGIVLSQLLDGHPGVLTYPHKFRMEWAQGDWLMRATTDGEPEELFHAFLEPEISDFIARGYRKGLIELESVPFIFVPLVQKRIFLHYLSLTRAPPQRDVLNTYMTSYFGAWLNNQNTTTQNQYITVVGSGRAISKTIIEWFFRIYPEGRLIAIVNEALNSLPTTSDRHTQSVRVDDKEADDCRRSITTMLWAKEAFPDQFLVLKDEDLRSRKAAVMRCLAEFLGICYEDTLLTRSFNRFPIQTQSRVNEEDVVPNKALCSVDGEREEDWPILADEKSRVDYRTLLSKTAMF